MDWSPSEEAGQASEGMLLPAPVPAELQELSFTMLPGASSSGRRLGRRISHKKSASDTFAFAAGQDFLSLLSERPDQLATHTRQASTGFELAAATASISNGRGGFAQQGAGGSFNSLSEAGLRDSPTLANAAGSPTARDAAAAAAASASAAADAAPRPAHAADAGPTSPAFAEGGPNSTQTRSNALDTNQLDPRKAKRILANRQSAQRSRMKRLQYISELEGRQAKAEAGVRELRGKVDTARRAHAGLQEEVEQQRAEFTILEQQLLYEQGLQANLSSYVHTLELQFQQQQQQQQWCYSEMASYQLQQAQGVQCANEGLAGPQDGTQIFLTATAQYTYPQQQACYAATGSQAAPYAQQLQQQWQRPPHVPRHQQQALQHQQQACGYGYGPAGQPQLPMDLQQPGSSTPAGHCRSSGPSSGGHSNSMQAASAGTAMQQGAVASTLAGAAGAAQGHPLYPQHQQQSAEQHLQPSPGHQGLQQEPRAGVDAGAAIGGGSMHYGASPPAAAAAAACGAHGADQDMQFSSDAALAAQAEGVAVGSRPSLSQGSGSVLMHGSLSDPDLDSILGLGGSQLEAGGSSDIRQLLGEGDSDFMLTPDELLLQANPGSLA